MGHLVNAIENPEFNKQVHTYNLYKEQDFFGYGIAFHTEDISISKPEHRLVYPLIEIEDNSPAAKSGMKNYQRVVAVNGEFVNKDFRTLEDVVQSIEDSYYSRDFSSLFRAVSTSSSSWSSWSFLSGLCWSSWSGSVWSVNLFFSSKLLAVCCLPEMLTEAEPAKLCDELRKSIDFDEHIEGLSRAELVKDLVCN